jgi:hypothetical protein
MANVRRDAEVLLIVANERSFGKDGQIVPPLLMPRERAVLNAIPFPPDGIKGARILDIIGNDPKTASVGQSALTKDIIPKLKEYYNVANQRGVGYYRIPPGRK